ncbi:LacI family DNA-binding transcriptional regulator [Microvirga puerhi]|uniref:LacI family DNA-binding transcriptional regulator n=1 Tax=Microvirga puerhi TaxID=2876078 RepID=A0ABS7VVC0_9HYPH|nr:LacI family DNA-binding transcriptional regulator [Microvirga puerhi]MBZ6079096.1 LacI family DNA-binding transcriptional regulator [Microvirga puerhi]
MRDIAAQAGVAPITVSRALSSPDKVSPETLKKILEVVQKEGFIPNNVAGSMRATAKVIGTIVPPLINSGIADQVQGMSDACAAHGYQLLLVQGDFSAEAEDKAIMALLGWRPKGLIIQAFVQSKAARKRIATAGVPVVEISEIRGRTPMNLAVGISNFDAAYAMTQHLAGKGYKRIGFVSTPIHGNDRLRQRRVGYRKAIADLGIDQGDLEVEVPITSKGGAAALSILTERDPSIEVIFCSSDLLAFGAVQECRRRGWAIPDRIAIAGFGDMDLASQTYPAITTVRVDRYGMGRSAVDHLLSLAAGETGSGKSVDVGFEIIDRESA